MSKVEPTREEYDTLQCKLATLEAELRNTHNLLEPPAKVSWWRRFWELGAKASMVLSLIMVVLMVGIASGKEFVSVWQKMKEAEKGIYVIGYYNGMIYGSIVRDLYPKKQKNFLMLSILGPIGNKELLLINTCKIIHTNGMKILAILFLRHTRMHTKKGDIL